MSVPGGKSASEYRFVSGIVEQCQERAKVGGKSSLFLFCRIIAAQGFHQTDRKTGKKTGPADPEAIADFLEEQYAAFWRHWGRSGRGADFWADKFPQYNGREEFLVTLQQVRVPDGKSLLELAIERAREHPLEPIVRHSPAYRRFISIAGHLQRARAPGQTIQLGVEKIGKILEVDPKMVSQYRKWAVEECILQQVRKHNTAAGLTAEFIFHVQKFNWRTGKEND
jgi:hypothetical protein